MSVNVNTVYQRVLAITNKEQRGYITPQEFNYLANQAQLDIFEQYFYDINQFSRIPGNDTEYSDMLDILEKKLSLFEKTNQTVTNGITLPSDLYRLGSVIFNNAVAELVTQKDWIYIKSAPLAQPTNDFPIYIKDVDGIEVYGKDSDGNLEQKTSNVTCNYTKTPSEVSWGYNSVTGTYDASNSTNFELHASEETDLVIKILALAGIILKDNTLYGIGSGEDVKNTQSEKS
jgi:hypothetical protein